MSFNELDLIVLKNIITNKKNGLEFAGENDSKLFSPEVWNFANQVINHIKTYKELPTLRVLTERLLKNKNEKLAEAVKNVWIELDKIQIDEKEYKHDLEKIKKRFAEKQLMSMRDDLSKLDLSNLDINKVVSDIQNKLQPIKSLEYKRNYESKSVKDYLPIFVDKFNARKNNPNLDRGLMTKYSFIDYCTNGLKQADFLIIAGESGFGKSLFLNNIGVQVWLQNNKIAFDGEPQAELTPGKNIIYFSLEMPYEDCFNRFLSCLSGVPSRKIENSDLTKDEFAKIKTCLEFIKNYPYNFKIVDIVDACANDLEAILVDSGENFDAIFIDYLGIMKPNEKNEDQDWLKQGIIAYEVRAIGRRHEKPMFSAVQLNKKSPSKESSDNIGLNRLARSGTIATHATHVIQIENRPNEDKHPDFLYHFIKNRKGPKGKGTLIKNLACAKLIDREAPAENDNGSDNKYDDFFIDQDDISEEMEDLEL